MHNSNQKSAIELLAGVVAMTGALIGFNVDWAMLAWGHDYICMIFIPLFLASTYSVVNWFGFDFRSSILGISPRVVWVTAFVLLVVFLLPIPIGGQLQMCFWLLVIFGFAYYVQSLFRKAEKAAQANRMR